MCFALFFIVGGGLLVVGGVLGDRYRKISQSWQPVADACGVEFRPGGLAGDYRMEGEYDGVEICVHTETRGLDGTVDPRNVRRSTNYEASVPSALPSDLVVVPISGAGVGAVTGGTTVELGFPDIDDALVVETAETQRMKRLCQRPGVEEALREMAEASNQDIYLDAERVHLKRDGYDTCTDSVRRGLDLVADIGRHLQEAFPEEDERSTRGSEQPVAQW